MNDELLIELVRNHSALYDLSNPKYMDTNFKNEIWNKIGEELETDGLVCKFRWNNMRDNYRKALKKTATKSGQSIKNVKIYKYGNQMSFIQKYFDERKNNGKVVDEQSEEGLHDNEYEEHILDDSVQLQPISTESVKINCSVLPSIQAISAPETTKKFKRQKNTEPKTVLQPTTSMKRIRKNERQFSSPPEQHPVDAFLAGVAPTLKFLTPFYFHFAKNEIFSIVQKYEKRMLIEQQSSDGRRSSPPTPGSSAPLSPAETSHDSFTHDSTECKPFMNNM